MDERSIESRLRLKVKKELGGIAYKFTSPQRRSVPDRLCLLPGGEIFFVECKSTGKFPTKLQKQEHETIRSLGFSVHIVDSYESVDILMEIYKNESM